MRRIPVLLAVTALAAAVLAGCSTASDSASCVRPSADPATLDLVEVSGPEGEAPDVEVRTPFHVASTTAADLEVGDGVAIVADSQVVALDIAVFSGETGDPLVSTSYEGEETQAVPLTQWTQTLPGLTGALECATEGSRVVVALAPEDIAADATAGLGLEEGETAIAVVDLHRVYLAKADGADQFVAGRNLPTVVRAPDGRPGIIVPEGTDAPTEPVVETLKKGDGDVVTAESTVVFAFTSVDWSDPQIGIRSTWDAEPATTTLDQVPPALADALTGKSVGSQLLVVQPATDAVDGQEGTPALVYVIDILGIS